MVRAPLLLPMPRATKFTDEARKAIIEQVRRGAILEVAAQAARISYPSAKAWLARGRKARAADEGDDDYVVFADDIEQARAAYELQVLEDLKNTEVDVKGAGARVRALQWLLEKRCPDRYGAHSKVTLKVEQAQEYLIEVVEMVCERMGHPEVADAIVAHLAGCEEEAEGA